MVLKPLARIPGIGEAFRRLVREPLAVPSQRQKRQRSPSKPLARSKRSRYRDRSKTCYDAQRFKKHVIAKVLSSEELLKKYPPVFTLHHVSDILGMSTRKIQHWIRWGVVTPIGLAKNQRGCFSFLDLAELACAAKIRTCLFGGRSPRSVEPMVAKQLPQLRKAIEVVLANAGDIRDYRFELSADTNTCSLVPRTSALDRRLLRRQIDIGAMWKSLEIMAVKVTIRNKKIESMKTF